MKMPRAFAASILFAFAAPVAVLAQAPPINYQSTEIHTDHTITFRYKDAGATKVMLNIRDLPKPMEMTKGPDGVWTITTQPLPPANPHVAIKWQNVTNLLTVPGDAPQLWDPTDVPHGELHHHFYTSKVVLNLPGNESNYYVYTPPGYDPKAKTPYPVLYLLHGFNEGAYSWTDVGKANNILDNLLAQGKIKPMIVAMPLGYGDLNYVRTAESRRDPALAADHLKRFQQALLTEVLPQVEATYRVARDRDHRAIAGLSMGGAESVMTGLNALDRFAWVGSFSAGGLDEDYSAAFPKLDAKANSQLKLLWIACGVDDGLIKPNRKFRDWLQTKDVKLTFVETPGTHCWMVWRRNLVTFASLLFQDTK